MNYFLCDLDKRGICFDPSSTLIFLNSDFKKKTTPHAILCVCVPMCLRKLGVYTASDAWVILQHYCKAVCMCICVFSSRWRPSEQLCPQWSPAMSHHHPAVAIETVSWCAPQNSMSCSEHHGPTAPAARPRTEHPRLHSTEPHSTGPASGSSYKPLYYIDQTLVLLEWRLGRK